MPVRRFQAAFTLVELAAVVVILALLAAMAMPRVASALTRNRADAAAGRVRLDLLYAQERARGTSASVTAVFDAARGVYQLEGVPDLDRPGSTYEVRLADEPYLATLVSADFGGDATVIFNGYGDPDSGGTVVLRVGDETRAVTLDAQTGKAKVQ